MPSSTSKSVFEDGKYVVSLLQIDSKTCGSCTYSQSDKLPPPKPLLVATPLANGKYPLLIFLHGYLLLNSFYSQLIQHIASYGYIVIAPQLYKVAGPDTSDEISSTAAITDWLSDGLQYVLPHLVQPNLSKIALSGHSRGGKVAFALANTYTNISLKFSALMGIDPVDGMAKGKQTPPRVLTYTPRSLNPGGTAILVVGSGLGEKKKNILFPPCAPKGVNHEDFFNECSPPTCYFVVKDYGHTDMLDDVTNGIRGQATYCTCKNGKAREPMRRFVGGIMVAFMRAFLEDDYSDLNAIRDMQEIAPVELQTVEFLT